MKILKIAIVTIVVLILIFFIGGMLLPKNYSVSRSQVINAPQDSVFMNVADFHKFLKWNPWTAMEPEAKVEITGTPAEPGHLWQWQGKKTGEGQMEIRKVEPYSDAEFVLTFIKPYESTATTTFHFTPEGNSTKVTWTMSGSGNSFIERWMYLNIDNMIGKDFERGLNKLKEMSEKNQ